MPYFRKNSQSFYQRVKIQIKLPSNFAEQRKKATLLRDFFWRRHPDLNWGSGCCRPTPYHLAIAPIMEQDYEARTRYLHLGKVALYQMS